jgi:membrane-bound lytic murein transglycosylase D
MSRRGALAGAGLALGLICAAATAADSPPPAASEAQIAAPAGTRNGREIYTRFREGLADPDCDAATSERWQRHFANAPKQLASGNSDALALFGYVVDALREASLPTEYALIPFVESGYKPGARSGSGPAGLWQFIALTARNHAVAIRPGYDGRLSPVESPQAAVRYLKTLHGMFAGDWRLAVMAYNAGEYRVLGALKNSGQEARNARPESLSGMPAISVGYVRKLHALSCVLDRADDSAEWLRALDRPITLLAPAALPTDADSLDAWAAAKGFDVALVKRINPAFADGRIARAGSGVRVLAPIASTALAGAVSEPVAAVATASADAAARTVTLADAAGVEPPTAPATAAPRTHTVAAGDSLWRIARRYDVEMRDLLARNGMTARSKLHPGMVLKIDAAK